ncbi:MAG: diguanylate cyclase [Azonexus sp.]
MPGNLGRTSLRMVIDSLEVGVIILDREQRILHSNRWLALRSGIAAETMVGRPFAEAFADVANSRLEQAIRHATHDRLPSLLSPALHGTLLPLYQTAEDRLREKRMQQMIHVLPLHDDSPASCLIQISDMTANISRERLLRQQTETLRRTTTQDALTGVANRRQFDEMLATEFHEARQNHQPLGLMMVDLDLFNAYNALYGREQGDARLLEIAAALQDAVRPVVDLVARYGGDEFALILPGINERQICQLAENLRLRVTSLAMPNAATSQGKYLTVSIGSTVMLPEGEAEADTHTLLSSADVALYQAKHDGRNRAIYFSLEDGGFKLCG